MKTIRILLVEDHQIVQEGLRRMLEMETDIQVVGEAGNGEEALACIDECAPDIVITDVKMPGIDGIELTRRLRQQYPQCQVMVLTFYDQFFNEALAAGAAGYLVKDLRREELVHAIRTVQDGRSAVHLTLDRDRLSELGIGGTVQQLSEREQAILRLVATGVGVQEIAQQLAFSESTVKRSLRTALGQDRRTQPLRSGGRGCAQESYLAIASKLVLLRK